jgi:hypothetical protein
MSSLAISFEGITKIDTSAASTECGAKCHRTDRVEPYEYIVNRDAHQIRTVRELAKIDC